MLVNKFNVGYGYLYFNVEDASIPLPPENEHMIPGPFVT
jgi:hypothetical protein